MLDKLKLYLKVRYTLIYVQTIEENRFNRNLEKIASEMNYNIKLFNFAQDDPLKFVEAIPKEQANTIFAMQDFHRFLTDKNTVGLKFIRMFKNYKEDFKNQNKIIIITAPVVHLPEDIIDDFVILSSPLPNQKEINSEIEHFLARNKIGGNLTESLKNRIVLSCLGLTIDQINKILAKTLIVHKQLDENCFNQIIEEKKLIISKNKILDFYDSSENMKNIGGLDNLKKWLRIRSKAFSQEAKDYGLPTPKGLLMLGVQGTGKSLTAKAVSSYWHLPLLKFDVGRVYGSLVGESENRIREAIKTIEAIAPCVLWIDEIDKAFAGLQGNSGDSGTSARVFGTFLSWMQEKTSSVFIAATANDVSKLPAELLRKGRFDEIFFVDLPNKYEREEIFKIHLAKVGRDCGNYDIATLVAESDKFTGAEIEQVIKDAMYIAFDENGRDFTTEDIVIAIKDTIPLANTMDYSIQALREWAKHRARRASYADKAKQNDVKQADIDIFYS